MTSEQPGTAGFAHTRVRIGKSVALSACVLAISWPFIQECEPGKFRRDVWLKTTDDVEAQRVAMGKQLKASGTLIGLNPMQVSTQLGKPQQDYINAEYMREWNYRLGTEGWLRLDPLSLHIVFNEESVVYKATVQQH
jgi:hypothetical protein